MGSCDQGRIKLSTQFLNFSVTVHHLCLEQCFLFTSKQLPVDRLNISLSTLQYTHTGIQAWTASERDALSPFSLPQTLRAFCKAVFPWHRPAGPAWGPSPKGSSPISFTQAWINKQRPPPHPPYAEQAQLISITRGCQHLLRGTAKVTALPRILMGREKKA